MKAMETIDNLIGEAKVRRTVWWAFCIFFLAYFLTHTSKSMWMNLPVAFLILCGPRILLNQNEFRRKVTPSPRQSHLYSPSRKQLSLNDAHLSITPPPPRWKNKINSPVVEAAINDFVDKSLDDLVKKLWYSSITPDQEFPELIRGVILNAVGEISVRVKEIKIVGLIRDIIDLICDHLESFRRNQAAFGTDVMKALSSEDRNEKLRCHLMRSGELYPALISKESEYKILQKIVTGILSVVLRPGESQCPFVQTIAREFLTCLVFRPLVNFASPHSISYNDIELLEESTQGEDEIVTEANGWHSDPSTSLVHNPIDMPPEFMPPNLTELILKLVDTVFQLNRGGWLRTQVFSALKQMLLFMGDAVDDWFLRKISWLQNEETVAHGIRGLQDKLWPNGVFFTRVDDGGMKVVKPSSLLKDGALKIKEFLFNDAPAALVSFATHNLYRTCPTDIFYFTQSNVCIKQLAFAILELLVLEVFPELQDLLRDIRENPPHGRSE